MTPRPLKWIRRLIRRGELDCDDIRSLSSDYVDGTISESVAENFRRHLAECQNCSRFVATFRATVLTLRDLPRRTAPVDLRDRVNERIQAEASIQGEGESRPA